uniref:Uncharacterized protein n=1 Tax=Setaria digitata TaxID=48799 RepID=A0A915PK13_9BILA
MRNLSRNAKEQTMDITIKGWIAVDKLDLKQKSRHFRRMIKGQMRMPSDNSEFSVHLFLDINEDGRKEFHANREDGMMRWMDDAFVQQSYIDKSCRSSGETTCSGSPTCYPPFSIYLPPGDRLHSERHHLEMFNRPEITSKGGCKKRKKRDVSRDEELSRTVCVEKNAII